MSCFFFVFSLKGNALQLEIVGASGKKRKVRLQVEDAEDELRNLTPEKQESVSSGIPSDIQCHDWYWYDIDFEYFRKKFDKIMW